MGILLQLSVITILSISGNKLAEILKCNSDIFKKSEVLVLFWQKPEMKEISFHFFMIDSSNSCHKPPTTGRSLWEPEVQLSSVK